MYQDKTQIEGIKYLVQNRKSQQALEMIEDYLKKQNSNEVLLLKSKALLQEDRVDEAEDILIGLEKDSSIQGEVCCLIGDIKKVKNDMVQANEMYIKSIKTGYISGIMLLNMQMCESSLNQYVSIVDVLKRYEDYIGYKKYMLIYGNLLYAKQEYDAAFRYYLKAEEEGCDSMFLLIFPYFMQGDYSKVQEIILSIEECEKRDKVYYATLYVKAIMTYCIEKEDRDYYNLIDIITHDIEEIDNPVLKMQIFNYLILALNDMDMEEEMNECINTLIEGINIRAVNMEEKQKAIFGQIMESNSGSEKIKLLFDLMQ